jgi:hypothetical protein
MLWWGLGFLVASFLFVLTLAYLSEPMVPVHVQLPPVDPQTIVPTPDETAELLRDSLIPLASRQLDSVNRDHGAVSTDALAILALDVAIGIGVTTYGVTNSYPSGWWASLVLVGVSAAFAFASRLPFTRRDDRLVPPFATRWFYVREFLRAGLVPDEGPDPLRLLSQMQTRAELDAYTLMLTQVLRSTDWSSRSLRLKTRLVIIALLLLPLDGIICAVLFLR